jgi:hypothetical protein
VFLLLLINPTASLNFSHVWNLIYPSHDDHTALNYYGWESRLNGRWEQTRGMGLRSDRLVLTIRWFKDQMDCMLNSLRALRSGTL